ncbi:ATP-binding protein [Streptomyces sp. LB8]|uniref:ATP-binding protein n=1 Tax=Streptomyces sp. LB8 TaxID=3042509 RepID=UPI002649A28F|nr:ATP-binding protein [Streptomyces sp. LB8]MDN5385604.1 ATP-binding protein [Streptomyces sp. LB8]
MHSPSPQRHQPVSSGPASPTEFAMAFTSTPRGARLARLFVAHCLDSWGHPYDSDVNETLSLITAELCANAVLHGRVPGRDFHVRLAAEADGARLRVEVSDTRTERRPAITAPTAPDAESESGRGLLLVAALADAWGVADRRAGPGKTVWAVVGTAPGGHAHSAFPARIGSGPETVHDDLGHDARNRDTAVGRPSGSPVSSS